MVLLWGLPLAARADGPGGTFDNPTPRLSFEYPAGWEAGTRSPRGLLPQELLTAGASGDATTELVVALYRLPVPLTDDNYDDLMAQLDDVAARMIAKLPGGKLLDSEDTGIDGGDGRIYSYEYRVGKQPMLASTTIVVNDDLAVEITLWAKQTEFDAKLEVFDTILDSLVLPWTERSRALASGGSDPDGHDAAGAPAATPAGAPTR
jgi:hypothetical protein